MNDHNLDDLIIDNIEPKNSKTKSFLTIIALLIVILIVAIILTKIILKDPNEVNATLDESTEMISPELTLQNVGKKAEVKEETKLSNIIEKELNEPVKAPEVKEVVEVVQASKPKINEPKAHIEIPTVEVVETTKAKVKKERVKITKEFDQSVRKTEAKPKVTEAPKAKVVTPKAKPAPVKKRAVETVTSVSKQIYYVQVGSFSQQPSKRLLSAIKNNGFRYRIKTAGSAKKVQIGPFKNRASASTALVRIRDRIKKDSFIVKK